MGKPVTPEEVENYRAAHERMRAAKERLEGSYGSSKSTSPLESGVMGMSWTQFFAAVRKPGKEHLQNRIDLLEASRVAFDSHDSFAAMDADTRSMIAGLPNGLTTNQGYFGSMKGDGYFFTAVRNSPDGISAALDCIPLHGPIAREHYESFVELFTPAVEGERERPGVASRLLALKRPDVFVCISSRNKAGLAADFGIPKSRIDFDRYWTGIVGRIGDARWWSHPKPTGGREMSVWQGRAAMLDAIFYEHKQTLGV